jgi:hypothetical protein
VPNIEVNAEFRNKDKAWLMIFRDGIDHGFRVSEDDVRDLLKSLHWLADKFARVAQQEHSVFNGGVDGLTPSSGSSLGSSLGERPVGGTAERLVPETGFCEVRFDSSLPSKYTRVAQ